MGAEGAGEIIFAKEVKDSDNPKEALKKKIEDYKEKFQTPYVAASKGYVDEVIEPKVTRYKLIKSLEMLSGKLDTNPSKKHGNIPL